MKKGRRIVSSWRGERMSTRYAAAVAAVLSCLLVGGAKADFTSGNQLWDACQADEAKDLIRATFCNAYIIGAGDALQLANLISYDCIPPNVQKGQVVDVVKLYLRDHPENRQF